MLQSSGRRSTNMQPSKVKWIAVGAVAAVGLALGVTGAPTAGLPLASQLASDTETIISDGERVAGSHDVVPQTGPWDQGPFAG